MSAALSSVGELVEADPAPADPLGQLARRAHRAVGHHDLAHPVPEEGDRRRLGHAPGADDEHLAARQVGEDVLGQVEGDGRHRRRAGADVGLGAHALAHLERLAEELVEQRPARPLLDAELPGRAHLALDLALPDDHRVEAAGDAEELGRRAVLAQHVAGAGELVGRHPRVGHDGRGHRVLGAPRVGRRDVDLGAVAGRERDGLGDLAAGDEAAQQRPALALGERGLLALLDRRGLVGEAEHEQRHARTPTSRTRWASSRAPASSPSASRCTTSVSMSRSTASRRLGMSR